MIFERLSCDPTPAAQSRARMCRDRCEIELCDARHIVLDFRSATERRSYFAVHFEWRICAASTCFIIASRLTLGEILRPERSSTSSPINSTAEEGQK